MKPSFEKFRSACPDVDERLLREHLSRLGDRYFNSFGEEDLYRHLRSLSQLSVRHPVQVLVDHRRDGSVDCTVLAFDYPSEFSIITGILAGMGFNIVSGDIFTYQRGVNEPSRTLYRKRLAGRPVPLDLFKRRRIIDCFTGVLETPLPVPGWSEEVKKNIESAIGALEHGGEDSVNDVRNRVTEMVVKRLGQVHVDHPPVLYPVQIEIDNERGPFTRLKVVSEDTPAFLYALSNALSLHDILIEHVRIRTIHGRIEDEIDLVDLQGRPIVDTDVLDRIKLSALLTKQFTYFLGTAPDPYAALSRFEHLVGEILTLPAQGKWIELLKNPHTLQDLARLLGASDFLWEDFIRLQYETLLPMLTRHVEGHHFSGPVETLGERLTLALQDAGSLDEKQARLNQFKDREIFRLDLDYILRPDIDFRSLAERLTHLAEQIVNNAVRIVYDSLADRFGYPGTVAGFRARYSILGLGKLGGGALGYASDIELLFVYSDSGKTDGERPIENAEFFDRLVKGVTRFITTKREGIFHIDLRLRPFGDAGPLACSLETFCRYYGKEGNAHSYERLALVRMRAIGGDQALGSQLERLRDEILYESDSIRPREILDLREKQYVEKTKGKKRNAKFSAGGLVDLEYGVQILQVNYGRDVPRLRTPRIHEALNALSDAGVLVTGEAGRLVRAYDFLRHLINSMRMLRGSAKDLFLPPVDSNEFAHLARRMGYESGAPLEPAQQLHIDFETHTAAVRGFTERHFGPESLPGQGGGTVADLILSDALSKEQCGRILLNAGFKNPERADLNLKELAGMGFRRDTFAKLALLAWDILRRTPDPDMALNNWERFIRALASPEFHFNLLLSQPMRLEILLKIFSGSQFLSDTLVRNPGFLDWVLIPKVLNHIRKREDLEEELRRAAMGSGSHREWVNKLRRFRRREILRIGVRDICLGISTRDIMLDLSTLAESCIQVVLERIQDKMKKEGSEKGLDDRRNLFCVMALGKLGGSELNYSSDIDLLGLWDDRLTSDTMSDNGNFVLKEYFARLMGSLRSDLSDHTEEGYAYRVDLRLRPFGREGEIVTSTSGLLQYYGNSASLWEVQAALKMRPVAGNITMGYDFVSRMRSILLRDRNRQGIVASIEKMRREAIKSNAGGRRTSVDVKSGMGGLRDVEFLVQGLQLIHAPKTPGLIEENTLIALDLLLEANILPEALVSQLKEDYIFLRRTEHYLQILEDLQIHALPTDPDQLSALSKRMLGVGAEASQFLEVLNRCLGRIHEAYENYLLGGKGA